MKYKLKAPNFVHRYSGDFTGNYEISTYEEVVKIKNGIAECDKETARDTLIRKGFVLIADAPVEKVSPPIERKRIEVKK